MLSNSFSASRRCFVLATVCAAFLVALIALVVSGVVQAHPEHPDHTVGPEIVASGPGGGHSVLLNETVTLAGSGFTALVTSVTVNVYGVKGLSENSPCPDYDAGNSHHFKPFDSTLELNNSGGFSKSFVVSGQRFAQPGAWGFCGVDGSGAKTKYPGILEVGRVPSLTVQGNQDGKVYPGETVLFTGRNFGPGSTVTIFAVKPESDGSAPSCSNASRTPLHKEVSGLANGSGNLLPTAFRLDDNPFISSLQWYFCAFDEEGEFSRPVHLHIRRVLRARTGNDGRQYLDYGGPNTVSIVPGLKDAKSGGADASVKEVNIGGKDITGHGAGSHGELVTTFPVDLTSCPGENCVVDPPGVYVMRVTVDETAIGDNGVIQGTFSVGKRVPDFRLWVERSDYLHGRTLKTHPGDTLRVGGSGFKSSQSMVIYAVKSLVNRDLDGDGAVEVEERNVCPDYSAVTHTARASGRADSQGRLVPVDFPLTGASFSDLGDWLLCGVDGAGKEVDKDGHVAFSVGYVLRKIDEDGYVLTGRLGSVLVVGEANRIRIVPPLQVSNPVADSDRRLRGWQLGLQKTSVPLPMSCTASGKTPGCFGVSEFTVNPAVAPGKYTLSANIVQRVGGTTSEASAVFDVALPGTVVGDYHLSVADDSRLHPGGSVAIAGSGFVAAQTARLYTVAGAGSRCPAYRPSAHKLSLSVNADADGRLPKGTVFPLTDDAYYTQRLWRMCAVDGSGSVTQPALLLQLKRALSLEGGVTSLASGKANTVLISPALPSTAVLQSVALGPYPLKPSALKFSDAKWTSFTVTPSIDPGVTLTLTVKVRPAPNALVETLTMAVNVLAKGSPRSGYYVSAGVATATPGDTLTFRGAGFTPGQTATVYAFGASAIAPCVAFSPSVHDLKFSAVANDDGTLPSTRFTLSDERFATVARWHFCAVDGSGKLTPDPYVLDIGRSVRVPGNILFIGEANSVTISPALPSAANVASWTVGPISSVAKPQLTSTATGTSFTLDMPNTAQPGAYTLTVLTNLAAPEDSMTRKVTVAAPDVPTLVGNVDSAVVGDTVTISGTGFVSGQTVQLYAAYYGKGFVCGRPSKGDPVVTASATNTGAFTVDFPIESPGFGRQGKWAFCGVGGAGETTPQPFLLTLNRTLVVPRGHLVQYRNNVIRIEPPLPVGSQLESVSYGGDPHNVRLRTNTVEVTDFVLVTSHASGSRILQARVKNGDLLSISVAAVPQPDPPVLTVAKRVSFGSVLSIEGSGFRSGSKVRLMGQPKPSAGLSNGAACAAMLNSKSLPFDVTASWTDAGVRKLSYKAPVSVSAFSAAGAWVFCAADDDRNVTAKPYEVLLVPGISVPNAGRVKAGQSVGIEIVPAPGSGATVSGLRLGRRSQEFTYASGVATWTSVPEILGDHLLYLTVGEDTVSAEVTILSARRPDERVPTTARECPGLTETLDGRVPGGLSAMRFVFRISPDGSLECRLRADNASKLPGVSGVGSPDATTAVPSGDFEIHLNPEYEFPVQHRVNIVVSSYDNEFGHRYRVPGARLLRSTDGESNHRLVVPGCGSWQRTQTGYAGKDDCEIQHAKEILVELESALTLPRDASADYATQVRYDGSVIWDVVNFAADLDVEEDRAPYNQSVKVTGMGYPADSKVSIHGVNTSRPDLYSIPAEAETGEWNCQLVIQHGAELGETKALKDHRISETILVTDSTFGSPGKWLLCATSGPGGTTGTPTRVTIDYEAKPQTDGRYYAGDAAYVRVVPQPGRGREATGLKINENPVHVESVDDEVHFVVPVNLDGPVRAVLEFPDGLKAELDLVALGPDLTANVKEIDKKIRIGSVVRLEARNLSGERVCDPAIDDVRVSFLVGGRIPSDNCVVIGPNRHFLADLLILSPDGRVSADLVKLYDGKRSSVSLSAEAEDGARVTTDLHLMLPEVEVTRDNGEAIPGNVLNQFEQMTVSGVGFPRHGRFSYTPSVGYVVRDGESYSTTTDDGAWSDGYRVSGRLEEGSRLEFIPTIAGHKMPGLAFVISVGIKTPAISVDPAEVTTSDKVTISVDNLQGYTTGYSFAIVGENVGNFVLADYYTGELVTGLTDLEGSFAVTFSFPDYLAEYYDADGKALLTIQLYGANGEPIPEALAEITHVDPTTATNLDDRGVAVDPTPTPLPVFSPTPTPIPLATLIPTATPAPHVPPNWNPLDAGLPRAVNHNRIIAESSDDGRSVALDWERPRGRHETTGYRVVRRESPDAAGAEVANLADAGITEFLDESVSPATTYWYSVVSYNNEGDALMFYADPVRVMTPGLPGPAPGFRHDEPGSTLLSLRWDDQEIDAEVYRPALGYEIQELLADSHEWTTVARVGNYVRNWIVIDLIPGSLGNYRIAAYNGVGYGPWSELFSVRQSDAMAGFDALPAIEATTEPAQSPPVIDEPEAGEFLGWMPGGYWSLLGLAALAVLAVLVIWRFRRRAVVASLGAGSDEGLPQGGGDFFGFDPYRGGSESGGVGDLDEYGEEGQEELRRRLSELLGVSDASVGYSGMEAGPDGGDEVSDDASAFEGPDAAATEDGGDAGGGNAAPGFEALDYLPDGDVRQR